jgi:hypothetical protein
MALPALIREQVGVVDAFARQVQEADKRKQDEQLREVEPLIRFARKFYVQFFRDHFGLDVNKFSFRDKRKVSRRLVREESNLAQAKLHGDAREAEIRLGAVFEDLVDALHGDIEFGYSGEDEDFTEFHKEVFASWLHLLYEWLEASDEPEVAKAVGSAEKRYLDAIS